MQYLENKKEEYDEFKKRRMEEIIDQASIIFSDKGIDNTKVTDIAEAANVGVASVYRYFKTKTDIVVQVGIKFWKEIYVELEQRFLEENFISKNGIDQVREFGEVFITFYKEKRKFLKYLYDFDNYVLKKKVKAKDLKPYEENIINIQELIVKCLEKGQNDKTIKSSLDANEIYFTMSHTLMSLTQKLALTGYVVESDYDVDGEKQIEMIIEMIIQYIKAY